MRAMQASSVSPCVPEAARSPLLAVAVPTIARRSASLFRQVSSATCRAPAEESDEILSRQACNELVWDTAAPPEEEAAPPDAVVPSVAHPPIRRPEAIKSPNKTPDRATMIKPPLKKWNE